MKKIIAFDLDECLGELILSFLEYYNNTYRTSYRYNDVRSYNLEEIIGRTKHDAIKEVYKFYETNYFREISVVIGSREVVRELTRDNEAIIITSRPYIIKTQTERWLWHHFYDKFKEVVFTNEWSLEGGRRTKGNICVELGVNCLIEDNLDYALDCSKNGIQVFLLDKPWNQGEVNGNITRVKNYWELLEDTGISRRF